MIRVYASCTEYGAPEDGELKTQQPFLLKNQLLSKNRTKTLYLYVRLWALTQIGMVGFS